MNTFFKTIISSFAGIFTLLVGVFAFALHFKKEGAKSLQAKQDADTLEEIKNVTIYQNKHSNDDIDVVRERLRDDARDKSR